MLPGWGRGACRARTAVHADDAVLDERGQGEPVEERVEARPGPDALLVAQPLYALQPEAEQRVDVRRLRAAPAPPAPPFSTCSLT